MTINEIIEAEKRNKSNLYDIHFYLEGSFWRAYEWSAFLSRKFPSDLSEDERLRVMKKATKSCADGNVHVGLQLSSFEKYFPNVVDNDELFEMEDKHIIIHAESMFSNENFDDYDTILRKWKDALKLSKKSSSTDLKQGHDSKTTVDFDSLIEELILFQIENKTFVECLNFLCKIREKAIVIAKSNKTNS